MIVFTVTNLTTQDVYVGTTRNTIEQKWEEVLLATKAKLDYPLYNAISTHGAESFEIKEWAYAESTTELRELMQEAMLAFDGISLKGHKTVASRVMLDPQRLEVSRTPLQPNKKRVTPKPSNASSLGSTQAKPAKTTSNHVSESKKLSTGKTKSVSKEKRIREAIAEERMLMESKKRSQAAAEAKEMAEIIARLDAGQKK